MINVAFLTFCLLVALIYGSEIYRSHQGGFEITNTLLFASGAVGFLSISCQRRSAKLLIFVSAAIFLSISIYSLGVTLTSMGPIDGSGELYSPSIPELLLPLAVGALSGITLFSNLARDASLDRNAHHEGT